MLRLHGISCHPVSQYLFLSVTNQNSIKMAGWTELVSARGLPSTYCVAWKSGYLQNKSASLLNFVPNSAAFVNLNWKIWQYLRLTTANLSQSASDSVYSRICESVRRTGPSAAANTCIPVVCYSSIVTAPSLSQTLVLAKDKVPHCHCATDLQDTCQSSQARHLCVPSPAASLCCRELQQFTARTQVSTNVSNIHEI